MAREEPTLSEKMKAALLHWFNTVGRDGCGGKHVESMADLWKEHVPALLLYLNSECKKLKQAKGASPIQVYEEAMAFMKSSTESQHMAASLNATAAANGNELEISKFLLLFWHELCISDSKTIEQSIHFMELVNMQHTMGDAIEWMNKATENQDYNRWFHVLFDVSVDEEAIEECGEATTPVDAGDAKTPTGSADKSMERRGEETFTFTTPSNIPMRHSFYERDISSMRNSMMVTPRLSARRQLPVPSSEPRHFITPHLPVPRGSPIAEQLHSPAMREKRREREMRTLQQKMSMAQEERDSKEIEVKELKKGMHELDESNHHLKSKCDDVSRELNKELREREEREKELEGLRKEKTVFTERIDVLSARVKELEDDYEVSLRETTQYKESIKELELKLAAKSKAVVDLRDEVESRRMTLDETRDSAMKVEKKLEESRHEVNTLTERMDEMKEDWRRRLKEKEDELVEIQMSNHRTIGEMNGCVMEKDAKLSEVKEELDKERKKGEDWKREKEEEMRLMREDMENEKIRLIEEMREKKEKLDRLEEEREKMDKESGEKIRELKKKLIELDVKMMELEGSNISLKQKLSVATSNGENLNQEVNDLRTKEEAMSRMCEQLKGTIGEMEEERAEKEGELSRLRDVEEKNKKMMEKIEKLMKEKTEASEKAYSALLENDRFTAMIEKMKREEEERRKEEEWNETVLRSEITTSTRDKEIAEDELRKMKKEMEEERKKHEEEVKELMTRVVKEEEEKKNIQFIHKNVSRNVKALENELKKNEEMKKHFEDTKTELEQMKKEYDNMKDIGRENMENVVSKKKELETEMEKKDKIIDKLNDEIARMKESIESREREAKKKEWTNDTSMTTVKDDNRGTLIPQRTLIDFDEEPTLLYTKSNLSTMKDKQKDFIEVNNRENTRAVMERITEDKENDSMFMMTPANDRRQMAPLDSKKRVMDIANRNAKTLPHLRSSHTVEQLSPNFSQEGLREGVVRPSSNKKMSSLLNRWHKK